VELLLSVDGALQAIVEELARDRRPRGVGSGARPVDVVLDFLGDGGVEPGDNAGVYLEPLWIIDHGGGVDGAVDVVDEAEFLEHEFEEIAPLPEVAIIGREDDGNVVVDVEQHKR
jgi:hypothetical protein